MMNRLRRRLSSAIAARVDARLEPRLADISATRSRDSANFEARSADYEARLGGLQADYDFLRSEFDRLTPQLAALEYRFEELRRRTAEPVTDRESALEAARVEHERARLRLQLVSHYEERLRRLEADHD